jgi:hypothetical protein
MGGSGSGSAWIESMAGELSGCRLYARCGSSWGMAPGTLGKAENGICIGSGKLAEEFRSDQNEFEGHGVRPSRVPNAVCGNEVGRENGNTRDDWGGK